MRHYRIAIFCALLLIIANTAHAQRVQLRGRGDVTTDAFLRALAQRSDLIVISQDRGVASNDTLRGDVLVSDATLRLDGVITGDLIIVDGSVHLRPSARVLGSVRNIAGGFYRSELASIAGEIQSNPEAPYDASRRPDGVIVITGMLERRPISAILVPPTYDRVNGLTLPLGAQLLLPRIGDLEPAMRGGVEYASQRGDWNANVELGIARRRTELAFGFRETSVTNEGWIRGAETNSVSAIVKGKDYRDYFEVERRYVELRRLLERGARETNIYLRGQVEDAEALAAGTPWSVLGDFRQENITFPDSRISSMLLGGTTAWTHPQHVLELEGVTEFAFDMFDGDHTFNRFYIDAEWAMPALKNHTLELDLHFQGPLPGTDSLPMQRWSFVGGSGTLYTFDIGEFPGDRVVMVETEYSIPLPRRLRLWELGVPSLDLLHLVGMAWSHDLDRSFEQNIGLRIAYNVIHFRAVTNPKDFSGDAEFTVGISMPRRSYPWQNPDDM
jgi:hypothetical protein